MLVTRRDALMGLGGAALSMLMAPTLDGLSLRSSRVAIDSGNLAVGQSASAIHTVALGQTPIDLVLDPTPSRDSPDGRIFVSVQGPTDPYGNLVDAGSVRTLDASDGRTLRDVRVGYAPSALALDARTGHLFVVNRGERTVSMLDTRSGALPRTVVVPPGPWKIVVDSRADRAILVGRGVTDAGNAPIGNGSVSLLDIASGRVLSKIPVAGQPDGAVVDARRGRAFVTAAALPVLDIAHGRVSRTIPLSISTQGLGLDETTGRLFAITSPGNTPVNGPPNDTLTMLDGQDGRALSAVAIGNNQSQVIVDENAGRVVVIGNGSNGGLEVDVADARTGRLLRKTTTTAVTLGSSLNAGLQSPSPVVDARRGRVYLALTNPSDPTKAYAGVCDTRTGALLRTTAVRGSYIQAMAIDARSGRLFVVSVAEGPSPQGYLTIIDL